MDYAIYGPFPIKRNRRNVARDRHSKRGLWQLVEAEEPGLSEACGCYIFIIRGKAWYVGRATKQTFLRECLSLHKIVQYNDALERVQGPPSLLLIAKLTNTGRFARPSKTGHGDIAFLENLLIGAALGRNPKLQNVQRTKYLRRLHVPGVLATRRGEGRAHAVQVLRGALDV